MFILNNPAKPGAAEINYAMNAACKAGNMKDVIDICNNNPGIIRAMYFESNGWMSEAVLSGSLPIVMFLHAKVFEFGKMYRRAGWAELAALNGHTRILRFLNAVGYDIKGTKINERTVDVAAKAGHTDTVEYLRGLGFEPTRDFE